MKVDPQHAPPTKYLSKSEEEQLRHGLAQLLEIVKSYPPKLPSQGSLEDWAKSEEWARQAMRSTHEIVDQLGSIQSRSPETRSAFVSALTAFDRITSVLEGRYRQQVPEDYAAAKLAVQTCIEYSKRLL